MNPVVSVIVLNWNGGGLIERCVRALLAQRFQSFEVIVVDQGSTDASTWALLKTFGALFGDRLRVIWALRNTGFARGNNLAFSVARAPWVALLNMDAFPEPGWLEALVEVGESSPRIGMCASRVVFAACPGIVDNLGHKLYADGLNVPRGRGGRDGPMWDGPLEVLCPSACAALYRRELVERVGGFDPLFFAYAEDLDLGLQIRRLGYRCLYVPRARVSHVLSASLGALGARKAFLVERNRIWVLWRHFPPGMIAGAPLWTLLRYGAYGWRALKGEGPVGELVNRGRLSHAMVVGAAVAAARPAAYWRVYRMIRARRAIRRREGADASAAFWKEKRFRAGLDEVGGLSLGGMD